MQKKDRDVKVEENSGLGIIGNVIDVKSTEKVQTHRTTETHHKKKAKIMERRREGEFFNPFMMTDMSGW